MDAALFEIVGRDLALKAGVVLDFEAQASFDVSVVLDDADIGAEVEATVPVTLTVTNVIEPRTLVVTPLSLTISEDTDTTAGSVKVADIDIGGDLGGADLVGLAGDDAALFEIVTGAAGLELHLIQNAAMDFTANPLLM